MSTPVVTNSWAGNFDCSVCRRKRLMAEEFSKKALEKHRKTGGPLKCKTCVQAAATDEREAAALRRVNLPQGQPSSGNTTTPGESTSCRICAKCQKDLHADQYNRNQWNKGDGKSKCRPCVEAGLQEEQILQQQCKETQLEAAKRHLADAETPAEKVAAESKIAALEAQKVTGLKPVRLGRGRGRGWGRGCR